jgi:2-dehydro-3-deoxy-D-gluconate 5-dehydrogenase
MAAVLDSTSASVQQLLDLSGRSAVVTGGAMGIGFGIARRLAEAGAEVTVVDVDAEAAVASARRLTEHGWTGQAIRGDVRAQSDVERMVQAAVGAHGAGHLG